MRCREVPSYSVSGSLSCGSDTAIRAIGSFNLVSAHLEVHTYWVHTCGRNPGRLSSGFSLCDLSLADSLSLSISAQGARRSSSQGPSALGNDPNIVFMRPEGPFVPFGETEFSALQASTSVFTSFPRAEGPWLDER